MRGCLFVLLAAATFVVAGSWFGGPTLAGYLVGAGLDAAGFEARERRIDATTDPPIEVLGGAVDRVEITASGATIGDLTAGSLHVILFGVDLVGRSFRSIEGELIDVTIRGAGGSVDAERIDLTGEAGAVRATVRVRQAAVADLVASALRRELGFSVGQVTLEAPDVVVFSLAGLRATGRLRVEDGALWLAAQVPGDPRVELIEAGDPLTLREVGVGEELLLVGTLDVVGWLR
jgi:hypothetical protein